MCTLHTAHCTLHTAQVPIEGEMEGGVEWVADQAAITVQELREVKQIKTQPFSQFENIFLIKGGAKAGSWGEERKGTAWPTFHCNLISTYWRCTLISSFYCKMIFTATLNPCGKNIVMRGLTISAKLSAYNTLYLSKDVKTGNPCLAVNLLHVHGFRNGFRRWQWKLGSGIWGSFPGKTNPRIAVAAGKEEVFSCYLPQKCISALTEEDDLNERDADSEGKNIEQKITHFTDLAR